MTRSTSSCGRLRQLLCEWRAGNPLQLGPLQDGWWNRRHSRSDSRAAAYQIARVTRESAGCRAPLQRGIRVGEVHAEIAQRGRAEQGIGDGVRQHVGVGMAFQTEVAGNGDPAQDEWPAGSDAVDIPAEAGAIFRPVTQ